MKRRAAISCSLAIILVSWTALAPAAPRTKARSGGGRSSGGLAADPNAKKVDVFQAVEDKQIQINVIVQSPISALLTLTNISQESLNVEVPLALGAVPQVPQGANQQYYLAVFGTPAAPQSLAVAVNPQWAAGVGKKSGARKTNVKTNRKAKPGDEEAKDEKKDEDKDAKKDDAKKDDAKKGDALVAQVPLPPGATQQLPMSALGLETLDKKLAPRTGSPYSLADLDKVSQAPEIKKLLEYQVQGKIPPDSAQVLAWHYHGRLTWDEMAKAGFPSAQLQAAQQYAEIVEGRASPDAAPQTSKKKR